MLESFTVKNFRCFRELTIEPLERVNLIGGKNNVGKTALLEAIHLHCLPDKPELWIKVHNLRGIQDPLPAMQEIGEWLFFQGSTETSIASRSRDAHNVERSTVLHLVDATTSRERFDKVEQKLGKHLQIVAGSDAPRLILEYSTGGEQYHSVAAPLESAPAGAGPASLSARVPAKISNIFLGSLNADSERDVRHFGELESAKRLGEVLPALREIEPGLQRLSLVPFAGETVIHADIDGTDRLVPISLVGEGMRRLLSILLAIANVRGGIVFIDEIENGLHYSIQKDVWSAVAHAARRCNVQVFATTHSYECIEAAHRAFEEIGEYDFRYFRLERRDEQIVPVSLGRDALEVVERSDLEIR
jgi:hypothetical protein